MSEPSIPRAQKEPPRLFEAAYDELRRIAAGYCRRDRDTIQPTALVHEVYLRLVNGGSLECKNHRHFLAIAATLMRETLVDHIRQGRALKRGGGRLRMALDEAVALAKESQVDLLELDEALERLRQLDSRKAEVVEMRFFGSLTIKEIAEALDVAPSTVEGDWYAARAWLRQELGDP